MPVNSLLLSFVTGLSFLPNTSSYILFVKCTGSSNSKRITFEATEAFGNARGVYKARYAAPAGTQWSDWERDLTNADFQRGIVNIPIKSANAIVSVRITFPRAFSSTPVVVCSPITGTPDSAHASPQSITAAGCNIVGIRTSGSESLDVYWVAISR